MVSTTVTPCIALASFFNPIYRAQREESIFFLLVMKRTPEPELMQIPSHVRAYADADFSRSDSMVVKSLETYLKKAGRTLNKSDLIFDLGCGPGNIAERLA